MGIARFFAAAAAAAAVLLSCASPLQLRTGDPEAGTVTVAVDGQDSAPVGRTILPAVDPRSFRVSFSGPSAVPAAPLGSGSFRLAAGTWTATAEGLDGSGAVVVRGSSAPFALAAGGTASVRIRAEALYGSGTGRVDLAFNWPASGLAAGVDGVRAFLGAQAVPAAQLALDLGSDPRSLRYGANLAAGSYKFRVEFMSGATRVFLYDEALQVAGNALSAKTVVLQENGLPQTLAAPANLAATAEAGGLRLAWSAVAGATGYGIERRAGGPGTDGWAPLASVSAPGYLDASAAPGATYGYRVTAYDDASVSPPATTVGTLPLVSGFVAGHEVARLAVLSSIPRAAIVQAKTSLRIVYGHTSHGSQVTDAMTGLTTFAAAPEGGALYKWNRYGGGSSEALALHDYGVAGDLGNPDRTTWASRTRTYLNANPTTNVVMWSWCGQAGTATSADIQTYLDLMSALERDYPAVKFVYMTGHLDGTGVGGNLHQRNEQIRAYCRANGKWLFDFADIESYDPDGNYYLDKRADDECYYYDAGNVRRNWATAWQDANPGKWYGSGFAHTQPANANMKAYAAWNLFARMAGWNGQANP